MKEFKHTKGPWFINESEVCAELKEGIITIAEIARTGAGFTRKEEDANAKLIAAAPELLEALKEMMAFYRTIEEDESLITEVDRDRYARAKDAIRKATIL